MISNVGYTKIDTLNAAKSLSQGTLGGIPATSNFAIISVETTDVRWRDDGTAPTATEGMLLKAGTYLTYEGWLDRIKFIGVAAGSKITANFYRQA